MILILYTITYICFMTYVQVLKIIGAIAGEGSWGAATEEGSGILLQDLWQAALSTKEGEID